MYETDFAPSQLIDDKTRSPLHGKVEIVDPIARSGWDALLKTAPGHSFYYTESWARVLYDSYRYKPMYFTVIDRARLRALLPVMEVNSRLTGRRGGSLPFSDYCEPVVCDDYGAGDLIDVALDYGRKASWRTFEFRGGRSAFQNVEPFSTFYLHQLALESDEDKIFSKFRSSTRRNIRKAIKAGVEIKIDASRKALKAFCEMNNITKKRQGIPIQPAGFFKNIYKYVISKNKGTIALAYYENKLIASAMYFHFGNRAIYNYGASDMQYQNLRANNLLMWEAIRWYIRKGMKSFSFGITDEDNDGLRRFKNGMATSEKVISYYKYDFAEKCFVQNDATSTNRRREIFKKLPIAFLKLCGAALYRHYG